MRWNFLMNLIYFFSNYSNSRSHGCPISLPNNTQGSAFPVYSLTADLYTIKKERIPLSLVVGYQFGEDFSNSPIHYLYHSIRLRTQCYSFGLPNTQSVTQVAEKLVLKITSLVRVQFYWHSKTTYKILFIMTLLMPLAAVASWLGMAYTSTLSLKWSIVTKMYPFTKSRGTAQKYPVRYFQTDLLHCNT